MKIDRRDRGVHLGVCKVHYSCTALWNVVVMVMVIYCMYGLGGLWSGRNRGSSGFYW